MKQRPWNIFAGWASVVIWLVLSGCGRGPRSQSVAPTRPKSNPRQSFDRIMECFKRHFTGFDTLIPTHLGTDGEPRQLLLQFVVEDISYKVAGCDQPAAPCMARMSVRTSTHYSLLGPSSSPDSKQGETGLGGTSARTPSAQSTRTRFGQRDDAHSPSAKRRYSSAVTGRPYVRPKTERKTDTYEFAYENGRWVLKTPPAKTRDSMQAAIEFSLENQ